ncbi:MAG: bifunctional (p)ppGpp synthetase/guanosine-3',5'-bis(diphosphate) 3'-pyrophosphohydrolase [Bacteroidota bacterium]
MIQASAHLDAQLRELKVDAKYRRGLRVLIEHARRRLPSVDEQLLRRAFQVAYWAHRNDRRADGSLYIAHPLEVATIAARDIAFDDVTVAAALLHDTVEDTDISLDFLEAEFGAELAQVVDGVTKIDHVFESKKLGRDENVRKLMLSMASDIRVILVKFADRLHNMRTLESLPQAKQLRIASDTLALFAPLSHRFGLNAIKTELEDLCLKYIDPERYQHITKGLKANRRQRETYLRRFIEPVQKELEGAGLTFEITGRPKSIYSIYRKMKAQEKDLDEIYDLLAIRIILESEGRQGREDCWRVYSILTDLYPPIPERFRDFISLPKSNGYQSLHTTVIGPKGRRIEIQVRTQEMHEIAERGVAAHWKYKEKNADGSRNSPRADERLDSLYSWVRDMLENPQPDAASDFVQEFALNLYAEEIYVFTPAGDLLTLPRGATPVDFAYQVHTEVGNRCIGAKVNGKMVPLSHKLASGDQVEILTSKKQSPNPDWANFVVTTKAKARIRQHINEKRRKAVDQGRAVFEKRLAKAGVEIDQQAIARTAAKLKFPDSQQVFYEIGTGTYDADTFITALRRGAEAARAETEQANAETAEEQARFLDQEATRVTRQAREANLPALIVDGEPMSDLATRYANCCNPIPGDEVVGFASKTGAITIHRGTCRNALHLMAEQPERILPVDWSRQKDAQFIVGLRIIGEDRVGIVSDLTTMISKNQRTNIRSITVESEDGMFEGNLVLFVSDLKHLQRLMDRMRQIDGIFGVYRFEE